ncbi:hypothetical protein HMPREF9579_01355 [Cutibacterium acnes HL087PA1]|nr:hypothetical protein HMPREF9579_01355 [Cutibacterium acnes HL087PA1]
MRRGRRLPLNPLERVKYPGPGSFISGLLLSSPDPTHDLDVSEGTCRNHRLLVARRFTQHRPKMARGRPRCGT